MEKSTNKTRVFADANILFAGSSFPRWSYEILQHALNEDYKLVICPLVIDSTRRHLQKRFPEHIGRFENFLQKADYELAPDPTKEEVEANHNLVRDESDIGVALAAIAAKVDYLVSEDKDLSAQDETTSELRRHIKVLISGTFYVKSWAGQAKNWKRSAIESGMM
jgi:predicted nucleic acid-binding protein